MSRIQLALGLPFELRLRQLDAHHRGQALGHVVAAQVASLSSLNSPEATRLRVQRAGHRLAESGQVRAAVLRC